MLNRKRLGLGLAGSAVLLLTLCGVMFHEAPPPKMPVITTNPAEIEFPSPPLLDRIAGKWNWVWRIRTTLLPRKPITINSRFVESNKIREVIDSCFPGKAHGFAESQRLRLWILTEQEYSQLTQHFDSAGVEVVSSPQVKMADHGLSQLGVGTPVPATNGGGFAGTLLTLCPRLLGRATDLTFLAITTELITNDSSETGMASGVSIWTNLSVAGRVRVPAQGGLLLLQAAPEDPEADSFGLLITTDTPSHKRRDLR